MSKFPAQKRWGNIPDLVHAERPTIMEGSTLFLAKIPPLVVDLQETRGGILATHHPAPFGARLYSIFGRACGAILLIFLHFRAFQIHC